MKLEPRKTFQNLSQQKKERITHAAIEEFSTKGFAGASINSIVAKLKIAKGSIFQYFGDKKGLFLFVFDQSVEMVKNYLRNVRDQSADEKLPVRLEKTLTAGVQFIKQHPLLYRLYLRVLFDAKVPFRDEILQSLRAYSFEFLQSLLEAAKNSGELNENVKIEYAAFILDAIMDRFLQAYTVKNLDAGLGIYNADQKQTDEWIQSIVKSICQGIAHSPKQLGKDESEKSKSRQTPFILILSATEDEILPMLDRFETAIKSKICGKKIIYGKINGIDIKLLITGPGIVNTAHALTATIEQDRPCLIIQTGCAGAFKESGLKTGDIGIATEEIDIQLGIESPSSHKDPTDLPFPLFRSKTTEYTNRYPVSSKWLDTILQKLSPLMENSDIKLKKGPFITVSTITSTDETARSLFKHYNAVAEQMEGSASAHVSALYEVPFLEVRGISNMVGRRDKKSWDIPLACNNCMEMIVSFIQLIDPVLLK